MEKKRMSAAEAAEKSKEEAGRIVAEALRKGISYAKLHEAASQQGSSRGYGSDSPYRGCNQVIAEAARIARGYRSRLWLTFDRFIAIKNADLKAHEGEDGYVSPVTMAKGSRSIPILRWDSFPRKGSDGSPLLDADGKPVLGWYLRRWSMFNADCFTGLDLSREPAVPEPPEEHLRECSEYRSILESSFEDGPAVKESMTAAEGSYDAASDTAVTPAPERCANSAQYLYHLAKALALSCEAPSRRGQRRNSGCSPQLFSGLMSEIAACMICSELGALGSVPEETGGDAAMTAEMIDRCPAAWWQAYSDADKAARMVMPQAGAEAKETA